MLPHLFEQMLKAPFWASWSAAALPKPLAAPLQTP